MQSTVPEPMRAVDFLVTVTDSKPTSLAKAVEIVACAVPEYLLSVGPEKVTDVLVALRAMAFVSNAP